MRHHLKCRRFALLVPAVLASCLHGQNLPANNGENSSLEYKVKAAFLLNFTKFVDWPTSEPDSPFNVCVIGEDPFGATLDRVLQGESVSGHKIVLQRSHDPVTGCQLAYIGKSEKSAKDLLSGVGAGVLTVGEGDTFLRDGGVIACVLDHRRVRFNISLSAARSQQLTLSSRLLAVARSVEN